MQSKNRIVFILAAALILGQAGCKMVTPLKPQSVKKAPDPAQAILYGRFALEKRAAPRLLLVVENLDTEKTYHIRFEASQLESVLAVAVPPGTYKLSHVLFTLRGDAVHWQGYKRIGLERPNVELPFHVDPGRCYYIGDFSGAIKSAGGKGGVEHAGGLTDISLNFNETTTILGRRYPRLGGCEKIAAWQPEDQPDNETAK
jgi:hypothetical protein